MLIIPRFTYTRFQVFLIHIYFLINSYFYRRFIITKINRFNPAEPDRVK